MTKNSISYPTLMRLPQYLNYIQSLDDSFEFVSATIISKGLNLNEVVVRKDLATVSSSGKPKRGYERLVIIKELKEFLGYNDFNNAIIVGAGRLGNALLYYEGFKEYGVDIIAAFDLNITEKSQSNKPVFHIFKLKSLVKRLNIKIGIITVPKDVAQTVCDNLIDAGIVAIWNFAPTHLLVPENIILHNENLSSSLVMLSGKLKRKW